MADDQIAKAIRDTFISTNVRDSMDDAANVVDALDRLASVVAKGLKWLGTGDAATPFGAIEAHAMAIKDAGDAIAGSLESVASALNGVAEAIRESK